MVEGLHKLLFLKNSLISFFISFHLRSRLSNDSSSAQQFVEVLSLYFRAQNGLIWGIQEIIQGWYKVC
jgi:hypothetical protein